MDFKTSLRKYLNEETIDKLIASFAKKSIHALLLNEEKISKEEFLKEFPHLVPHPIVPNGFLYDPEEYEFGKHIYHEMGVYYLQEPSAMLVAYLLNPQPGEILLDMCAAPGGKSIGASLLMKNKGVIYSNDLSNKRTSILLNNVERMGRGNILITNNDFSKIYQNYLNYFDKIILDAPCSGSGMFRKEEKMLDDWSYNKVIKFQETQKELLLIAYQMLKPGGIISYSTCSYSYEEDEEVIKYLLDNEEAEIIDLNYDNFYQDNKLKLGYHLFPHLFDGEGHYICLIKKPGSINNHQEIKEFNEKDAKRFGDYLFYLPLDIKTKGLNIVRYGLKIKEFKGKDSIYSYHFSHYINDEAFPKYELSKEELNVFLTGNVIKAKINKGDVILTYHNINLALGKSDGEQIKNGFPKYLRNRKYIY